MEQRRSRRRYGTDCNSQELIWSQSPEKILGVSERWAATYPEALAALLRALYQAAQWCGQPGNHREAAAILARGPYLGRSADLIARALSGQIATGNDVVPVPDFFVPHAHHATLPRPIHALWLYAQMVRWGHVRHVPRHAQLAGATFRPDIYRAAVGSLSGELPPETGGDRLAGSAFFDGRGFDAADLAGYIASQRPYA